MLRNCLTNHLVTHLDLFILCYINKYKIFLQFFFCLKKKYSIMYNLAQRANAIFAFAMTVQFGLLLSIALSSLYLTSNPTGKVDVHELNIWLYNYDNKETEFAFIEMDIDAGKFANLISAYYICVISI